MQPQPIQWRPVHDFEDRYEVSSDGRVRSLAHTTVFADGRTARFIGRVLKGVANSDGYLQVTLIRDGERKTAKIHRLVAEAFVHGFSPTLNALHRDGNTLNNTAANLYWGTLSQNQLDAVRHGTHPFSSRTHCPQGHPYDALNTYIRPTGHRDCRTCKREQRRAWRANRKAVAA